MFSEGDINNGTSDKGAAARHFSAVRIWYVIINCHFLNLVSKFIKFLKLFSCDKEQTLSILTFCTS